MPSSRDSKVTRASSESWSPEIPRSSRERFAEDRTACPAQCFVASPEIAQVLLRLRAALRPRFDVGVEARSEGRDARCGAPFDAELGPFAAPIAAASSHAATAQPARCRSDPRRKLLCAIWREGILECMNECAKNELISRRREVLMNE